MANKIGIVLALDGEEEFTNGMKSAKQSAKLFDQELKNLEEEYKGSANTIEALTAKQEKLTQKQEACARAFESAKGGLKNATDQYRKAGQRLEELKDDLDKAKTALKSMEDAGDTSSKAYRDQAKAVEQLEKAVTRQAAEQSKASNNITRWETNLSKAEGEVKKANAAVQKNEKYLDEASKSADGCAKSIDKMGKEAGETATETDKLSVSLGDMVKAKAVDLAGDALRDLGRAAVEAGKYAVEVGSSFEQAMSKVEALSGASGTSLEQLSQKAQELGRTTQFSATEAANALGSMALAGWDTQQMLDGIDGVLQLAASGEMDLATAADAVAGYLAAFNMQASESTKLVDIMATAQASSKTTADQLSEAYSNCATNLTQAGQSVYTTTALIEGLASVNDVGSAAGTHLSAVMAQITQKMKDGSISIGDTKVAVQDANGNFRDMIDIIGDVEYAVAGMGDAERAAALSTTFNRTSMSAMNELLAVGSDKLRSYSDELMASAGSSAKMMDTMTDNFKGAQAAFNSATEGLGVAVYNKFSGALTGLTNIATDAINGVTDLLTPEINADPLVQYIEDVRTARENLEATVAAAQDTVNDAFTSAETIGSLGAQLIELNSIENPTLENKYKMRTIVEELSQYIPELAAAYDQETGSLKLTNEQILEYIDNKQKEMIATAEAAAKQQIVTDMLKAQSELLKSDETVAEAKHRVEALEMEQKSVEGWMQAIQNLQMERISAIARGDIETAEQYNTLIDQASTNLETLGYSTDDFAWNMQTLNAKMYEAEDAFESATAENEALRKSLDESEQQLTAVEEAGDALEERLTQKLRDAVSAGEHAGSSAEALKDELRELRTEHNEAANAAQRQEKNVLLVADAQEKTAEAVSDTTKEYAKHTVALTGLRLEETDLGKTLISVAKGEQSEAQAQEEATKKTKEATDAAVEFGGAIADVLEGTGVIERAGNIFGDFADNVAKKWAEVPEKIREYQHEIEQVYQDSADAVLAAWDQLKDAASQTITFSISSEFDGGDDLTTEKMNENLQSQIEGYQQYYENLQRMRELVAEGIITPEFFSNMEQQGTAAANEIQHMIWTIDNQGEYGVEQVKGISDKWTEALNWQETIAAAIAGDQAALEKGLQAMGSTEADFSELRAAIEYGMAGIDEETRSKIDALVNTAEQMGVKIPEGLTAGIEKGEISANAVTDKLEAAIQGSLSGIMQVAESAGVQIPDSISEGIASGEMTVTDAYNSILELLSGSDLSGIAEATEEAGAEASANLAAGLSDGEGDVTSAAEQIASAASTAAVTGAQEFNRAGQVAGTWMKAGLNSKQFEINSAGQTLSGQGASGAVSASGEWNSAGANAGSNFVSGVNGQAGNAYSAGQNVSSSAKQGAESVTGWKQIGENMGQGIADGISAKVSAITNAAAAAVKAGIAAAEQAGDIRSPSRKTRDLIGKQFSAGIAVGIELKTKEVSDAAKEQMNSVLIATHNWLAKNKKTLVASGSTFAESINYAWKQSASTLSQNAFGISRTTTTGTGENAKTTTKSATQYYGEILNAAKTYLDNVKTLYNVSAQDEKEYWETVRKNLAKGSQAWFDATKNIKACNERIAQEAKDAKEAQAKATEEAAEKAAAANTKIYNDAELHVNNMKLINKMSVTDELNYWSAILKQLKKGTDEYAAAEQKIREAKAQFGTMDAADTLLDNFQVYFEMSAKAEMQYWDEVRKHYKAGTAERIQADKRYLSARANYTEELLDAEEDKNDAIEKANETLNKKLIDISGETDDVILTTEQARAKAIKNINDKLASDIETRQKRLTDTITQTVKTRTNQIADAFDLFSGFESKSTTGEQLLFNMQTQAAGYADWVKELENLERRGVLSADLIKELREAGPQNSAAIHALGMLSDADLAKYNEAYLQKMEISAKQAAKDTAEAVQDLKDEAAKDIKELRSAADADIKAVDSDIQKAVAANEAAIKEASTTYDKKITELEQNVDGNLLNLATNIQNIAVDMTSALVAAFTNTEGRKAGAKGSVGSSVSQKVVNAVDAGATTTTAIASTGVTNKDSALKKVASTPALASAVNLANSITQNQRDSEDTIKQNLKNIIQTGKAHSKTNLSAAEKKYHELGKYIITKHGRTPTQNMYRMLAEALGISVSKTITSAQKTKILNALKKHGLRSGTRSLDDYFAWMDEAGIGSEMIVRQSDNARLNTSVRPGDAIIPAANTENLWEWSKISPVSEASLNARVMSETAVMSRNTDVMASMMEDMYALMQTYMPYVAQQRVLSVDGRELAEATATDTSNIFARRSRRRRA